MRNRIVSATALAATLAFGTPAVAQTEIQWWHAMAGELGQKIEKLATDFNATQKDFKVVP
ncbi:MAG: sn-glycerol-3-phosphate ABC transporter substrate-binding protein, partial [Hyphomicrobiales bacterium]|nr:sn-glycerol-3-phosphate ABC transporter substrate-binding protein [Hyphomicrobiales bacterium]